MVGVLGDKSPNGVGAKPHYHGQHWHKGQGIMDGFAVASLVGGVAFAISGVMAGARRKLDVVGIALVALLAANGGGVIRDLLVNVPPRLLLDMRPVYIVLGAMVVVKLLKLHERTKVEERWYFVLSDAVGLVAFAITGALVGMRHELSPFGVVALAFITAVGGGILRDVLVNEVPALLSTGFYGIVAALVAAALLLCEAFGVPQAISLPSIFAAGLITRLVAYSRKWGLPGF